MNATETIRKLMGWCPSTALLAKEEMYMASYEGKYFDKIKGIGFWGFLNILHLVFGVWLIITAFRVLMEVPIFPGYLMEIVVISSGILLAIGISSLLIFLNFVKNANVHRILALINITLLAVFYVYLSQSVVSFESVHSLGELIYSIFARPYYYYSFGTISLILFTLIIGIPSVLTLLNRPIGERKTRIIIASLLIIIILAALLGAYYFYLNKQKENLLAEGKDEYKIYRIDPGIPYVKAPFIESSPYFLDSTDGTTGHPISRETYEAIQFLRNRDRSKVMAWWDYELEIKASGHEPVLNYASKEIINTIGRPSLLYEDFDSHEKVIDVSRFFTADSEEKAKGIAEKYGSKIIYVSRQRWHDIFYVMYSIAADKEFGLQDFMDVRSPEEFDKKFFEPSMAFKFNSGSELKYFDKIFENKDVMIYEMK